MRRFLGMGILALLCAGNAFATISYHISLKNPDQHLFHVRMTIPAAAAETQVAIPAWNALYQVRDFSYRVRDVKAFAGADAGAAGAGLPLEKIDKQTWKIAGGAGAADETVTYTIEWDDAGPFNSQLNEHHAFVNLAEVLMYVPDRRGEGVSVAFEDVPAAWRSVAELGSGAEANSFTAESYDKLVDAPVEIGKDQQFAFDQSGAHFRVVVDGEGVRRDKLEDYLKRITKSESS